MAGDFGLISNAIFVKFTYLKTSPILITVMYHTSLLNYIVSFLKKTFPFSEGIRPIDLTTK